MWCGDIVDSSDEEDAKDLAAKNPDKPFFKCSQLSDNCIIFMYNPNKRKKTDKKSTRDRIAGILNRSLNIVNEDAVE